MNCHSKKERESAGKKLLTANGFMLQLLHQDYRFGLRPKWKHHRHKWPKSVSCPGSFGYGAHWNTKNTTLCRKYLADGRFGLFIAMLLGHALAFQRALPTGRRPQADPEHGGSIPSGLGTSRVPPGGAEGHGWGERHLSYSTFVASMDKQCSLVWKKIFN